MDILLRDGLPFVRVTISYGAAQIAIPDVVLDTGSAHTVLSADYVARVGIVPEPNDILYTVRGVGGAEVVFSRRLDSLGLGTATVHGLDIEIGGLDYGFQLKGILGMDFLVAAGAVIDLAKLIVVLPSDVEASA